jgi:hypothetical protein
MFSYCRSTILRAFFLPENFSCPLPMIRTLFAELVSRSVGRLLRLRQKYRNFETQKWWCRIDFRNAGYVSI